MVDRQSLIEANGVRFIRAGPGMRRRALIAAEPKFEDIKQPERGIPLSGAGLRFASLTNNQPFP